MTIFMAFYTKLWVLLNHSILRLIKQMNLLELELDGTRYLVLFGSEKCNIIYNRVKYLLEVKIDITFVFYHNYARIKVDSYDSLALEKNIDIS